MDAIHLIRWIIQISRMPSLGISSKAVRIEVLLYVGVEMALT